MLTRFTGTSDNKAGLVATVPMERWGLPEEIAAGIVFVASDAGPRPKYLSSIGIHPQFVKKSVITPSTFGSSVE
jgi:hypothetical protein